MELREEAWSPGPLDSEDQQMASHENPGEVALGSSQCPSWTPASFSPCSRGSGVMPSSSRGSQAPLGAASLFLPVLSTLVAQPPCSLVSWPLYPVCRSLKREAVDGGWALWGWGDRTTEEGVMCASLGGKAEYLGF